MIKLLSIVQSRLNWDNVNEVLKSPLTSLLKFTFTFPCKKQNREGSSWSDLIPTSWLAFLTYLPFHMHLFSEDDTYRNLYSNRHNLLHQNPTCFGFLLFTYKIPHGESHMVYWVCLKTETILVQQFESVTFFLFLKFFLMSNFKILVCLLFRILVIDKISNSRFFELASFQLADLVKLFSI
jgi:hypothetical protein